MHDAHWMGEVGQTGGNAIRSHFGPAKDDDALVVGLFQQGEEQFVFLVGGDGIKGVADGLRGGAAQADLNGDRLPQNPRGQPFDLRRHGGGEKEGLALGGAETDNLFDVRKKTHVQHSVHFVEDQVGKVGQVDFALVHEIEEPTRGGHHDVDPALDLFALATVANAAVDQADPQAGMFGKLFQSLGDLVGQLPRRFQNESAESAGLFQVLKNGQGEGGSFAGAGLGGADQVLAGEGDGDRLSLNRSGFLEAKLFHGLEDRGSQLERGKFHRIS